MTAHEMHETLAWLGDTADDLTGEQVERLHDTFGEVVELYPGVEYAEQRDAAMATATQLTLGEATLAGVGAARAAARTAAAVATAALRTAVVMAIGAGSTEVEVARLSGVDRATVRKWSGK